MQQLRGFAAEDGICDLLGYHAAYYGNALLTFHDNISVQPSKAKKFKTNFKTFGFLITEDRVDRLSRNIGKEQCETYWSHLQESRTPKRIEILDFLTLQDGTDMLYSKVEKEYYH